MYHKLAILSCLVVLAMGSTAAIAAYGPPEANVELAKADRKVILGGVAAIFFISYYSMLHGFKVVARIVCALAAATIIPCYCLSLAKTAQTKISLQEQLTEFKSTNENIVAENARLSRDIRGYSIASTASSISPTGFGISSGRDAEMYGCISYYNGWQAPDRAHGHGLFALNASLRYFTNSFNKDTNSP